MNKLVHFALAALFLAGVCSAQNLPPIEVFGGFSYFNFELPANPSAGTLSERLALDGGTFSASVGRWHHLSAEAELSAHTLGDCDNTTFSCSDFSYMFGPRYNIRDGKHLTGFIHALVGQDRATLAYNGSSLTDSSLSFSAGVGIDYWLFRHIGVQAGPFDYVYTRHLNDFDVPSQSNLRASVGVIFRFGGAAASEPAPKSSKTVSVSSQSSSRSGRQSTQPSTNQPSANLPSANLPGRGMSIAALGLVVGPQEFDGAKILEIDPQGVAEMASMKAGDLIKTVDGKPVRTPMELLAELSDKTGKVKIGIQRGDFTTETIILLGSR